jgi:hypothetical protein
VMCLLWACGLGCIHAAEELKFISDFLPPSKVIPRFQGVTNIVFTDASSVRNTNGLHRFSVSEPLTIQRLVSSLELSPHALCKCSPGYQAVFQGTSGVVHVSFSDHRFDVVTDDGWAICCVPPRFYDEFRVLARTNHWQVPDYPWVRNFTVQ